MITSEGERGSSRPCRKDKRRRRKDLDEDFWVEKITRIIQM
jgi:hypothetical protein